MESKPNEKSTCQCGTESHHLYNAITGHFPSADPSRSRSLQETKQMEEKPRKEEDSKFRQHRIKLPRFKADNLRRFLMTFRSSDQSQPSLDYFLDQEESFPQEEHPYGLFIFGSASSEKIIPSSTLVGEEFIQRDQIISQKYYLSFFIFRSGFAFSVVHRETEMGTIVRSNHSLKRSDKFMPSLLHPELLSKEYVRPYGFISRTFHERKHDRSIS